MKTREELQRKVAEILAEEFELEESLIVPEATLYGDLGLDSLDAVDMVVVLEKKFAVRLADENVMRSLRTVGDLLDFLETIQQE